MKGGLNPHHNVERPFRLRMDGQTEARTGGLTQPSPYQYGAVPHFADSTLGSSLDHILSAFVSELFLGEQRPLALSLSLICGVQLLPTGRR